MNTKILEIIHSFEKGTISKERKEVLHKLVNYIKPKALNKEPILLNFICTHNSRRSHLSQVWAQTMAHYFNIEKVKCYSGGTEATAMFPKVAETLENQGFIVLRLSSDPNPVYAIKFHESADAIICFSKTYDHIFNPKSGFGAVMTCDNADQGCPVVLGAEARISIKYEDPKVFDGTELMNLKYAERSLEIAQEMYYVFSKIA